jgi:hypothetical protein
MSMLSSTTQPHLLSTSTLAPPALEMMAKICCSIDKNVEKLKSYLFENLLLCVLIHLMQMMIFFARRSTAR